MPLPPPRPQHLFVLTFALRKRLRKTVMRFFKSLSECCLEADRYAVRETGAVQMARGYVSTYVWRWRDLLWHPPAQREIARPSAVDSKLHIRLRGLFARHE